VIACSGKVYYDLVKKREEKKASDVAIVRVEQLYPFPHKAFAAEMKKYPNATEVVWCQDEPQNQGAWFFVQHYIHENMLEGQKLGYAGRPASASPAVGYATCTRSSRRRCWTRPTASSRASSSPSKAHPRGACRRLPLKGAPLRTGKAGSAAAAWGTTTSEKSHHGNR
jgi:hypothetical protein